MSHNSLMAGWIVVSLVQAQTLEPCITTAWTLHHYAFQGNLQQLGVVNVGPGHHHAQRSAAPVNQDAPLAACLSPVRGVATD